MSSLYIVIPAYNESANIERTIDQWYPVVERHNDEGKSRLVIINDGSKDHTYQLLQNAPHHVPCLFLWTNQMVDMVLQFFMDTAMLFRIMQITFSRLILTDRPTRMNSSPSGTREAAMMR